MDFLLASQNQGKLDEFIKLFQTLDSQNSSINLNLPQKKLEVEESGSTYQENAFLKAKAYYEEWKRPAMADDSGLEVVELPGKLGVYSARYGGSSLSDLERCQLLLKEMTGKANREAAFTCVLCFYLSPKEIFFFEGRVKGQIPLEIKSGKGFGYDPIFIPAEHPEQKTFAEDAEWKNLNSHRIQAIRFAAKFFLQRNCQR